MRTSQYLLPTLKETPADAEIISHQLMLRAGLIRKLSSGLYSWLPLGIRTLRKVETVVRDELNKAGALELIMPTIQPADLWQESGRWEQYGPELLRMQDRHERDFCYGPTHEEVITDIVRKEIRSYKQLPLNLYQIQTKFRDEIRPRFGVMRAREFLMKDAYSFHLNMESLEKNYDIMHRAYSNIFSRLGLNFRAVMADSGSIGGAVSHEFQVLADSGEDCILYSDSSDYAANVELAQALVPTENPGPASAELTEIATPNAATISQVCELLTISATKTVKTLIVKGAETPVVALVVRGDHELNDIKAAKLDQIASPLCFADDDEINEHCNCEAGYLGPVDLDMPIIVDYSAAQLSEFVCGANKKDFHLQHVNWQRDIAKFETADIRNVQAGDPSPDGKGILQSCRGIEVGHIFQLGDKYSKAMDAKVLNENGKAVTMQMGCYGIGISRIVAAAIEQNHDDNGIIWTDAMAPFQVILIPIKLSKSEALQKVVNDLYEQFTQAGIEILLDDREERPGVMFANADLIGIPHRLVLGERALNEGNIEYKHRQAAESEQLPLNNIVQTIKEKLG